MIELLIGLGILVSAIVAMLASYGGLTKLSYRNTPRIQAAMLAEEGAEALRSMRDASWTSKIATLSNGTTYRLYWNGSAWTATTSVVSIDNTFHRTFSVASVGRDSNYNIVASGGTTDTNTKKVTVNVSWRDGSSTSTKTVEFYLFNTFVN